MSLLVWIVFDFLGAELRESGDHNLLYFVDHFLEVIGSYVKEIKIIINNINLHFLNHLGETLDNLVKV